MNLRTLSNEDELREALDRLNADGVEPSLAGHDESGPLLVGYLDGEGELPLIVVRAPGEDAHLHAEDGEDLCTRALRWSEAVIRWPIRVLDPFIERTDDFCRCDHTRSDHIYHAGACRPGSPCWCQRFFLDHRWPEESR